jgi:hypothetical protein
MKNVVLINSDKMEPIQLLKNDPTIKLSVLTKPKYASLYQDWAEVWMIDDVANFTQARDACRDILRHHSIDAIVTPYERCLLTGGFLRSYFGLPGAGFEQMLKFANKLVMKNTLQQAHIPVTPFVRLDRLDDLPGIANEHLGWPVVVKPIIGSGAFNTYSVTSLEHFAMLQRTEEFTRLDALEMPLLLERYVEIQNEYHCDGVIQNGQVVFLATSRYWQPVLQSLHGLIGSCILDESDPMLSPIQALHTQTVNALGMTEGITHMEIFETHAGLLVGEITCRPAGGGISAAIRYQYGIDIWRSYMCAALNNVQDQTSMRQPGVIGWAGLPGQNGYIVKLTPVDELLHIPGVIDVKRLHDVGEVLQERQTSVFYTTTVHFHGTSNTQLLEVLQQISHSYQIEILQPQA